MNLKNGGCHAPRRGKPGILNHQPPGKGETLTKETEMSVRTIYKCDKCGKEQETHEQFWKVGVVAFPFTGTLNTYSPFVTREHEQQV